MRMPLIMLPEGTQATVVEVHGGRGLCRRLAEMGFNVGDKVRMIKNHRPGPVMVEVKDSRVALGRGVTMKIVVEEN
ncbi:ferrous iron transport protein A [Candidatus Bathyarchaeota archaeon]|nr:ferrous iron transport protein A [Candidatus Bathyarchaeota archaeon]